MIVGIDLGTTNSLISYFEDGQAKIIPNRLGDNLTPSVVSIDDDGTVYVGKTAKERMLTHPEQTASVFKRSMGTGKIFSFGKHRFGAEELASLVLKYLKADAEAYLGEEIREAVISVPAYFNDAQRKATKKAGELAGFFVERIVSEPTAAAIAYGMDKRESESKFLVFDLGGGTFDVSILELFENIMEVRAVAGDNYLGGEDFTEIVEQMFLREHDIDISTLDEKTRVHIRKQAECAKLELSEKKKTLMSCKIKDKPFDYEISLNDFEDACQVLLTKIKRPIERSLRDAGVKMKDIDEVVLVGGATKLPTVRRFVSKLFGRLPNVDINPDEVVAIGAATQAAMKERNEAVKEVILTDVCPFTLGTSVCVTRADGIEEAGHYMPIIERNSVIPISRKVTLYTARDNQDKILVKILQGESRHADDNLYLGELTISVPPAPQGREPVEVTYTYDVNSLLEVEVEVVSTKSRKRIVIKNENLDMTDEEIDARFKELAALKIHPKDQEENKLLLLRGERMYEETTGDTRKMIEYKLELFEGALNKYDKVKIKETKEELESYLDYVEESEE
ncbi:MAG: molecular chaperone HscC [Lachnospiraceae bacterium]|nr:molecular chaperone HscC [Lachnospiraceae bacterium]